MLLSSYIIINPYYFLQASTAVIPDKWFYLLIKWTRNDGISMYVDNQLKESTRDGRPNAEMKLPTSDQTNLVIGRNIDGQSVAHNAHFSIASLVVFNKNIPTQSISPVTKYFSDPREYTLNFGM